MSNATLRYPFIPELGDYRIGKVRDIYENEKEMTLITSDRISIFDRVLDNEIPDKGRILTKMSLFWFEKTKDLIPNHVISHPDPNVMVVKKCKPIEAEIIVRAYLVGSMWRDYKNGKREKCGISIQEGLEENAPLPNLIVTPTTKSHTGHDEDITKEELIKQGIVTKELWEQIEKTALTLFKRGQEVADKQGLILVDTKYEFGLDEKGQLILIDEIHTPDSSRFWYKEQAEKRQLRFPDKEHVREWGLQQGFSGSGKTPEMPLDVINKVRENYRDIYEKITGEKLDELNAPAKQRLVQNLRKNNLIKGCYAVILMGSEKDQHHADKITAVLEEKEVPYEVIIGSAHKVPKKVLSILDQFNNSAEPIVFITIAGRSNALSGVVAANTKWPVIACPPFKDHSDYLTNIHSTLQMPSLVPAMCVVDPGNAALAAYKILKTMECTL